MIKRLLSSIFLSFIVCVFGFSQTLTPTPELGVSSKPDAMEIFPSGLTQIPFYRYRIDQDIDFGTIQFLGRPLLNGLPRCVNLDFAVYDLNGNQIYSEEYGTTLLGNIQEIEGIGKFVKLTFKLATNLKLKKGTYYFGFKTQHKYIDACPYNVFGKLATESAINVDCFSETDISNTENSNDISYLIFTMKIQDEKFPQKLSFDLCNNDRLTSGSALKSGCWQTHVKFNVPFIKLIL